jgi:CBS domain-containing protein
VVGIISERDVVHAFVRSGRGLQGMRVSLVTSTDIVSCEPDDSLVKARTLLHRHRIRRLPVVEHGTVLGILSIRDLLDTSLQQTGLKANAWNDNVIIVAQLN